jgi:ribosomal protein S8
MQNSIIPIFLSKINAARQGHFVSVKVELCTTTLRLLNMFQEIGVIRGYHIVNDENKIKVMLKYVSGSFNIFYKIALVSRPGKRVHVGVLDLYKLKEREGGTVLYIISTPFGILFDSECLLRRIGGEVLIKIII